MRRVRRAYPLVGITIVTMFTLASGQNGLAQVSYEYTGNPFDPTFSGTPAVYGNPFTSTSAFTGTTVFFNQPLSSLINATNQHPDSVTFRLINLRGTPASVTMLLSDGGPSGNLFSFNSSGFITTWSLTGQGNVWKTGTESSPETFTSSYNGTSGGDSATMNDFGEPPTDPPINDGSTASNSAPGTWSEPQVNAIPEPASLLLAGVLALVGSMGAFAGLRHRPKIKSEDELQ
jgi:hypothetical protein